MNLSTSAYFVLYFRLLCAARLGTVVHAQLVPVNAGGRGRRMHTGYSSRPAGGKCRLLGPNEAYAKAARNKVYDSKFKVI